MSEDAEKKQAPEPTSADDVPPSWLSKQQLKKWNKKIARLQSKQNKEATKNTKTVKKSNPTSPSLSSANVRSKKREKKQGRKHLPQYDDPQMKKRLKKSQIHERKQISLHKRVKMFDHLPQYETSILNIPITKSNLIHPAVITLGLYYSNGIIKGANARCVAMLNAFKQLIQDSNISNQKRFSQELITKLNPCIQYLEDCRPKSISMGNTIRFLKSEITSIDKKSDKNSVQKKMVLKAIDDFITTRIEGADMAIVQRVLSRDRIKDGDCILTYAKSYVVEACIMGAYEKGIKFKVIIVDSRPLFEGKELLNNLVNSCPDLEISYTLINSLSYVLGKKTEETKVSKVLLGASSIFANGTCSSRVGTSYVALIANNYRIPVLICCETYKFSERVQIDSICANELGDFDQLMKLGKNKQVSENNEEEKKDNEKILVSQKDIVKTDPTFDSKVLGNWRNIRGLKMLNIRYDLTPPQFITIVITEIGEIPPTSAPVIIREYHRHRDLQ